MEERFKTFNSQTKDETDLHVIATGTIVPLVMWCSISSPYYNKTKNSSKDALQKARLTRQNRVTIQTRLTDQTDQTD